MITKEQKMLERFPKKLVMITESKNSQQGKVLSDLLNQMLQKNYQNIKMKYQQNVLFENERKEAFLDKVQQQKTNFRFGILKLFWMKKYLEQKPSILMFLIQENFSEEIEKLVEIYNSNEEYLREKKIQVMVVMIQLEKSEDQKNIVKQMMKLTNKQIIISSQPNFKDVLNDLESYIITNIDVFYQNQINKYEQNLQKAQKKSSNYAEFSLRNHLKIAFMSLFIRDNNKAIQEFSKVLELGYQLLQTFSIFYNENVTKTQEFLGFFYYVQKTEELKKLTNLAKIWVVFLKQTKQKTNMTNFFLKLIKHLKIINKSDSWIYSRQKYFYWLSNIHFYELFLRFYENNPQILNTQTKSYILNILQNYITCNLNLLKKSEQKVQDKFCQIDNQYYGILLEEETMNLEQDQIRVKNMIIIDELNIHEFQREKFLERSQLIKRILEKNYDDKLDKLFNIVVLLENDLNKEIQLYTEQDFSNFLLISNFQNFPNLRRKCLETLKESHKLDTSYYLKEQIEYGQIDQDLFTNVLENKEINTISLELQENEFEILKIFMEEEVDNFYEIDIDFIMKTKKSFLAKKINKVSLIFNMDYYNKSFEQDQIEIQENDEYTYIKIKGKLKNHNILENYKVVILEQIFIFLDSKIKIFFEKKLPLISTTNFLKFRKQAPFSVTTNLTSELWSKDLLPLKINIQKTLKNHQSYLYQDIYVQFKVSIQTNEKQNSEKIAEFTKFDLYEERDNKLVLLSEKGFEEEKFLVSDLMKEEQLEKILYFKIEQREEELNLNLKLSFFSNIKYKDEEIRIQFEENLLYQITSKQTFHVSRNLQSLEQNLVTTNEMKKCKNLNRVEVGKEFFLNFYIKSLCDHLVIQKIDLNLQDQIKEIEKINIENLPQILNQNEGTNFSYVFTVLRDL